MNIFVSHPSPHLSAFALDDKRVVKMVLETCQLLSTAMNVTGGIGPYKTTPANHPCSKWAREAKGNYSWLFDHFDELLREYTLRYDRIHKCEQYYETLRNGIKTIPDGEQTSFVNCTLYKDVDNIFVAYKQYLNHKWANDKRPPRWYKAGRANENTYKV